MVLHKLAGEPQQILADVGVERGRALAIGPQELLIAGYVTRLYRRRALRLHENVGLGPVLRFYQTPDLATGLVIADNGDKRRSRPQCPEVPHYIARPAEGLHLALDPQHRDWRFGGDSLDLTVNVVIEHHVTDTQHARRLQPVDKGEEIAVVNHRQFLIAEPAPSFDGTGKRLQEKCRGFFPAIARNASVRRVSPVPVQQQVDRAGTSVVWLGRCNREDMPPQLRFLQPPRNRALEHPRPAWAESPPGD